jgi:ParB-like chromosome segregation protein Spo0J
MEINTELKKLIPDLTKEEYDTLEKSILEEGIRDPLIVWSGYIVDGHNRYEIAQKHGLDFETVEKEFDNIEDVKLWMIDNQKGRRNLTDGWKYELAQVKKSILAEKGMENIKTPTGGRSGLTLSKNDKVEHNTQKAIAQELGWSTGKTAQADYVWNKGDDDIKEKVKNGDYSINQAYKEVKREDKERKAEQKKQEIAEKGKSVTLNNTDIQIFNEDFRDYSKRLNDDSVDAIITDPPYPKEYLSVWEDMFSIANRILKPSSFLIAYSGQMYLDKILRMDHELIYYWLMAIKFTKKPLIHGRNTINEWKPIFIFQKKPFKKAEKTFSDMIEKTYTEREMHDKNWGQTVEPFEDIIERFTVPGDTIFEPFAGSGTTLVAAKNKNRKCIGTEIENSYINIIKGRLVDDGNMAE